MYYFKTPSKNFAFIVPFLITIFLSGCSEDEPEPEPPTPWSDNEILPGNFSMNSADITMTEDVSSIDFYSDGTDFYSNSIRRSVLPSSDFEFYSIYIYVPTDLNFYVTSINGAGARLYYYDENSVRITADNSSSFIETITRNNVSYSVYEIIIRDTDFRANSRTFEKIVYSFNVEYEEGDTGNQVHSSLVNVEVYADTPSQADNGDVTFWVSSDFGCGLIDVTLTGAGTGTISSFYGANPGCNASGSANFNDLEFGTYAFSAVSSAGCTWSGNIIVDSSCYTLELTF